jgi:hypothetical protein
MGSGASATNARGTSTLFAYSEPTLRAAVTLAALIELAAVLALAGFVLARLR